MPLLAATFHLIASALGFDWVDLLILLGVGYAAVRGGKLGAAVQLGSYGGFWLGLLIGAALAPKIASLVSNTALRSVLLIVILFGFASIVGGGGRYLGTIVSKSMAKYKLKAIDSGVGAGVSVVALLLVIWVTASIAVNLPYALVSSQVANSAIVKTITKTMPPAPALFARVQSFVSSAGFPSVFASLPPAVSGPVTLPSQASVDAVAQKVEPSVVKVQAIACGQIQDGSGFVVQNGIVVTNAHVVAGSSNITVIDAAGSHPTSVLLFNPKLDIAVLKVQGLTDAPLPLLNGAAGRGVEGVVLGYPGGGPLTTSTAGVMDIFTAQGRDIYNQTVTDRLVYELEAIIRPGNSGGPIVNLNGQVIGVVFSRSTTNPDVGFALAMPAVISEINTAVTANTVASTSSCAA